MAERQVTMFGGPFDGQRIMVNPLGAPTLVLNAEQLSDYVELYDRHYVLLGDNDVDVFYLHKTSVNREEFGGL